MRNALLALTAICAASFATPAAAGDLAYCIKGCNFGGGAGDCSFSSLAQCQATASGRDATCVANPYFVRESDADGPPSAYRPLPGRTLPPAPGPTRY